MLLCLSGQMYYGDECLNRLALISTPVDLFNRLAGVAFSRPALSRATYPFLKAGRNLTLRILGREKIQRRTNDNGTIKR